MSLADLIKGRLRVSAPATALPVGAPIVATVATVAVASSSVPVTNRPIVATVATVAVASPASDLSIIPANHDGYNPAEPYLDENFQLLKRCYVKSSSLQSAKTGEVSSLPAVATATVATIATIDGLSAGTWLADKLATSVQLADVLHREGELLGFSASQLEAARLACGGRVSVIIGGFLWWPAADAKLKLAPAPQR